MKKIVLLVVLLLAVVGFAASIGYSSNNSAPSGECYVCHTGTAVPAKMKLAGVPKQYERGKIYNLTLTVSSPLQSIGVVQGGFSAEATAGELIVTDGKNTQISLPFITHTQEGSEKRTWKFAWKAPEQKMDVELKVRAIAADGDYSPNGDAVTAEVFTIKPKK